MTKDSFYAKIQSVLWKLDDIEWCRYNFNNYKRAIRRSYCIDLKDRTAFEFNLIKKEPSLLLRKAFDLTEQYLRFQRLNNKI